MTDTEIALLRERIDLEARAIRLALAQMTSGGCPRYFSDAIETMAQILLEKASELRIEVRRQPAPVRVELQRGDTGLSETAR